MKKLKKIIGKVLKVNPNKINGSTTPNDIKSWDSFHGLLLVTELENSYNVKFTMEDIISVKCVGHIKKCLQRYGVKFEKDK